MLRIVNGDGERIMENGNTLLETDAMLLIVTGGFVFIPLEAKLHYQSQSIIVYDI
jgi:hypothetical protein